VIAILVQVIKVPGNGGVIIPREQSAYAGILQSFGCNRLCNLVSSCHKCLHTTKNENERYLQRRGAKAQSFIWFSLLLCDSAFILTVRLIVVVGRGYF
jgi:hypothetical protein